MEYEKEMEKLKKREQNEKRKFRKWTVEEKRGKYRTSVENNEEG